MSLLRLGFRTICIIWEHSQNPIGELADFSINYLPASFAGVAESDHVGGMRAQVVASSACYHSAGFSPLSLTLYCTLERLKHHVMLVVG